MPGPAGPATLTYSSGRHDSTSLGPSFEGFHEHPTIPTILHPQKLKSKIWKALLLRKFQRCLFYSNNWKHELRECSGTRLMKINNGSMWIKEGWSISPWYGAHSLRILSVVFITTPFNTAQRQNIHILLTKQQGSSSDSVSGTHWKGYSMILYYMLKNYTNAVSY